MWGGGVSGYSGRWFYGCINFLACLLELLKYKSYMPLVSYSVVSCRCVFLVSLYYNTSNQKFSLRV